MGQKAKKRLVGVLVAAAVSKLGSNSDHFEAFSIETLAGLQAGDSDKINSLLLLERHERKGDVYACCFSLALCVCAYLYLKGETAEALALALH